MSEQQFDRDSWQTPKYFFDWLNKRLRSVSLDFVKRVGGYGL